MKFGSPFRIFLRKMDIGCGLTIPFSPPLLVRAPRSICQNMRNSFDLVIFHNIYLSTWRPLHITTQCPDSRPCTFRHRYAGTYFKTPIEKLLLSGSRHRWRSIFYKFPFFTPIVTTGYVKRIQTIPLFPSFDDKEASFTNCIVRLIPLSLLIADITLFIVPYGRG